MKFIVREGFVVHIREFKKVAGELRESSATYNGGEPCELSEAQAREHIHKLEPAAKNSAEFLESLHVPAPAPVSSGTDKDVIAAAVAAGVAAAIKQLGLVPAKA